MPHHPDHSDSDSPPLHPSDTPCNAQQKPAGQHQGSDPQEYGQYGMRPEGSGDEAGRAVAPGASDYGAPTDHESFDGEYQRRELRDHRPRTIPTGVLQTPDGPGWDGRGEAPPDAPAAAAPAKAQPDPKP